MVTVFPPIVALAVSGGLAGGFCCAYRLPAVASKRPAHIQRDFIKGFPPGKASLQYRFFRRENCRTAHPAPESCPRARGMAAMMRRKDDDGQPRKTAVSGGTVPRRPGGGKTPAGGGRDQCLCGQTR